MGCVESIREKLVVDILSRFLQSDDAPLPCKLRLDSTLFSSPRSWIPFVDAEPFLYRRTVGHVVVEVSLLVRCIMFSGGCFAEFGVSLSYVDRVPFQNGFEIFLHPRSKTISYERDVFLVI